MNMHFYMSTLRKIVVDNCLYVYLSVMEVYSYLTEKFISSETAEPGDP